MSDPFHDAAQQWAKKWIESHAEQWWDPWGQDLHIALAEEVMRQMEFARASVCHCEFDSRYDDPPHASCHYHRVCMKCGHGWAGLHCPHDGAQNPCPKCGKRPDTIYDVWTGPLRIAPDSFVATPTGPGQESDSSSEP